MQPHLHADAGAVVVPWLDDGGDLGRNEFLYAIRRENLNSEPSPVPANGASPPPRNRGLSIRFWSSMAATLGDQLLSMVKSRQGTRSRGRIAVPSYAVRESREPKLSPTPRRHGHRQGYAHRRDRHPHRHPGPRELELIKASGFKRFPPRLPDQPIFTRNTRRSAEPWNVKASGAGFVTRFEVRADLLARCAVRDLQVRVLV